MFGFKKYVYMYIRIVSVRITRQLPVQGNVTVVTLSFQNPINNVSLLIIFQCFYAVGLILVKTASGL